MSLELRYGREDEELMGLQFCNEMIIVTHQIYPLQQAQKVSVTTRTTKLEFSGTESVGMILHNTDLCRR